MASNLSNYGTVTTKDILARRLYNDEIAGTNPFGMIVNSGVQLDIDAGTTIAITAGTNLDISAGAGLDFAVTGMTDLNSTTDVNLESGSGQSGNVIGDFAINSNGAFDVVAGNNASLAITGVFDTQVSSNITIDSSAGAIKIGGDANTGAIEIGKQGARTKMEIGNATVVEIEMNSLLMDLNVGASGLTVDVVGNTVINGAGAAGIACLELLKSMGLPNENGILCDTKGVIHSERKENINQWKSAHSIKTKKRSLL